MTQLQTSKSIDIDNLQDYLTSLIDEKLKEYEDLQSINYVDGSKQQIEQLYISGKCIGYITGINTILWKLLKV